MDILVIFLLCVWIFLAIRSMKKKKHGCSGNCLRCMSTKSDIHRQFRKDYPIK